MLCLLNCPNNYAIFVKLFPIIKYVSSYQRNNLCMTDPYCIVEQTRSEKHAETILEPTTDQEEA